MLLRIYEIEFLLKCNLFVKHKIKLNISRINFILIKKKKKENEKIINSTIMTQSLNYNKF